MLVLASNSPRRKQLLALGGWSFVILAAQVDERVRPGDAPGDYVLRLAQNKAQAAADLIAAPEADTLVLAADTAVVDRISGSDDVSQYQILGKPADAAEAKAMLRRLRGRVHQVYTGLALLRSSDRRLLSHITITDVPMRCYSDQEISDYIDSGDPFDKAGAYAIQHPRFRPVSELSGCYANVMGLPVCDLGQMLAEFGLYPQGDIVQACQKELGHPCALYRRAMAPDGDGGQ